ncbi:spore germination lipoprotein GerD [Evansella sp. AB-P1]|uniref:spore germination lipoprotein GerD n=1 Tax=Evansella sp. AB-P1 TaxID=3037653 RepID=UPI00241FAF7A|nr:spore germination lipoprotein GerD [Evansella sp. AB-P1]MDG5788075.1 spore germination lipoprotein GerD [Evansella sp. AB-P1]
MWHLNRNILYIGIIFILLATSTGCAAMEEQNTSQPSYESTKKMMVDMLQTEEGKKAIQEVLKDDEVKTALVIEQDYVRETIQSTLTSEEGKEYWQKVMQDPEFAKSFAESMQNENEKLLKNLMKDPEYQEMMISVLKDPEMEEEYLELMKSKEYRQQIMTVMTEAFESPFFVAKINEILARVAEEQMKKDDDQEQKKEDEEEE